MPGPLRGWVSVGDADYASIASGPVQTHGGRSHRCCRCTREHTFRFDCQYFSSLSCDITADWVWTSFWCNPSGLGGASMWGCFGQLERPLFSICVALNLITFSCILGVTACLQSSEDGPRTKPRLVGLDEYARCHRRTGSRINGKCGPLGFTS